jgi:hypothetical protein
MRMLLLAATLMFIPGLASAQLTIESLGKSYCAPDLDEHGIELRLIARVGEAMRANPPDYAQACEVQKLIVQRRRHQTLKYRGCRMNEMAASSLHHERLAHDDQVEICNHLK